MQLTITNCRCLSCSSSSNINLVCSKIGATTFNLAQDNRLNVVAPILEHTKLIHTGLIYNLNLRITCCLLEKQ